MRISTLFSCQYLILNFPHRVCTYENIDLLTIAHCFLIRYAHRVVFFCIQRFEQGMSEAKKRPSGAFSARLHRRGITINATCPVPSIVPLPRKRLTFSATGSVSPLSVLRCGNTASESLLLRQIKPPSFDGGFIFFSALSANWAFLPLLPQHLSCGEDGVANALRAGTEDLAGLHAL